MKNKYLIFNKETMEFRYGSGLIVYSEYLNGGRLLCSDYSGSGIPRNSIERDILKPPMPSFDLVIDGKSAYFGWDFEDYSASDDEDGRSHAVIKLKHQELPVRIKVHTLCGDNGYFTRYHEIENIGERSIALTSMVPLAGSLWNQMDEVDESLGNYEAKPFQVGYFKDLNWGFEGNFEWQDVPFNTALEFGSKNGKSGYTHPFAVANSRVLGGYFVCSLEWGANWKFSFYNNFRHIAGGGNERNKTFLKLDFSIAPDSPHPMRVIKMGEIIASPKVHFGYNYCDYDEVIYRLHSYQRRYLLAKPYGGLQPVSYDHWGVMNHRLTEDLLKREVDKAALIGCEVFTVDAGWFTNVGQDWSVSVGDWTEGSRLPNGLIPVFEYARSKDLMCGLWVEIESAGSESKIAQIHPEWFIQSYGSWEETGRILDLANPEVKEHLLSEVLRLIEHFNLDLFRLDSNNSYYYDGGFNKVDRYVENNLWKHVEAIHDIFDVARAKHPNVIFENCAGGGGRSDIGQLTRFSHTQISDWFKFPRITKIYNGMSMVLPPETIQIWVGSACDAHRYGCADTSLNMMVTGVPCISGLAMIGEETNPVLIEKVKKYISIYKKFIRPIHREVKIYHHTPVMPGNYGEGWCAYEFMKPDGLKGYATVYRLPNSDEKRFILKFRGVNPLCDYKIEVIPLGKTYKIRGVDLEQSGLEIYLDNPLTSELMLLEAL